MIVTRKTRCVFLGEIQDHHHSRNARDEGRLSEQLVGEIDDIHGTRKIRDIVRPSQRLEQLHAKLAKFVPEINTWTLLYNLAIEKHSGAQNQPNSLSQKIIDQGCAKGLYNPMDKRHKQVQVLHTSKSSPRRDLRCGHRWSAAGELRVLQHAQRLRCLLRQDPQGVHQKRYPHQGPTPGLAAQWYTYRQKNVGDSTVEKDKEYLDCKFYRKR